MTVSSVFSAIVHPYAHIYHLCYVSVPIEVVVEAEIHSNQVGIDAGVTEDTEVGGE